MLIQWGGLGIHVNFQVPTYKIFGHMVKNVASRDLEIYKNTHTTSIYQHTKLQVNRLNGKGDIAIYFFVAVPPPKPCPKTLPQNPVPKPCTPTPPPVSGIITEGVKDT